MKRHVKTSNTKAFKFYQMNQHQYRFSLLAAMIGILGLNSCQDAGGNQTGSEFIPDMAHSIAYEANTSHSYSFNAFEKESIVDKKTLSGIRLPVDGTIPRGYAGANFGKAKSENGVSVPANGSVPYYYANTEEDRLKAMAEITKNPFPISNTALTRGKDLYNIYCGICHGEKADGAGYLVRDNGGKYPAAPANLMLDDHINSTEGRYYHAIMRGRNMMGSYADKLSYEERWDVIHYIRSLQAKTKKLEYSEAANTFNQAATPAALLVQQQVPAEETTDPQNQEGQQQKTETQGNGH